MRTILTLSNINVNNFAAMHTIVGRAGYKGSLKLVNDEEYTLDVGTPEQRKAAGIGEDEVCGMIGELVMFTSVKVQSRIE